MVPNSAEVYPAAVIGLPLAATIPEKTGIKLTMKLLHSLIASDARVIQSTIGDIITAQTVKTETTVKALV